jgi:hypothetical protein
MSRSNVTDASGREFDWGDAAFGHNLQIVSYSSACPSSMTGSALDWKIRVAHKNKVLRSINNEDAYLCVDIFVRPDGTIGFEEYRRDLEDNRGWFPVGGYDSRVFEDESAALEAARAEVVWLRQVNE